MYIIINDNFKNFIFRVIIILLLVLGILLVYSQYKNTKLDVKKEVKIYYVWRNNMNTYEIIRDDGVVTFQEAFSQSELENNFLLSLRLQNPQSEYVVYKLDDDLNRISRKKTYIAFEKDKKSKKQVDDQIKNILITFMDNFVNNNNLPTKNTEGDV